MHSNNHSVIKIFSFALLVMFLATTSNANTASARSCKVKIISGKYKGRSLNFQVERGQIVGDSAVRKSPVRGCGHMKYVYGRWYHLCKGGRMVIHKRSKGKWVRAKHKTVRTFTQNCY